MENLYTEPTDTCKLISAKHETIQFLLGYSSSLTIVRHKKTIIFENNLN